METIILNPYACDACKKGHLKCSKQVPTCSQCLTRDFSCSYSPSRRKPKNSEIIQSNTVENTPSYPPQKLQISPHNHVKQEEKKQVLPVKSKSHVQPTLCEGANIYSFYASYEKTMSLFFDFAAPIIKSLDINIILEWQRTPFITLLESTEVMYRKACILNTVLAYGAYLNGNVEANLFFAEQARNAAKEFLDSPTPCDESLIGLILLAFYNLEISNDYAKARNYSNAVLHLIDDYDSWNCDNDAVITGCRRSAIYILGEASTNKKMYYNKMLFDLGQINQVFSTIQLAEYYLEKIEDVNYETRMSTLQRLNEAEKMERQYLSMDICHNLHIYNYALIKSIQGMYLMYCERQSDAINTSYTALIWLKQFLHVQDFDILWLYFLRILSKCSKVGLYYNQSELIDQIIILLEKVGQKPFFPDQCRTFQNQFEQELLHLQLLQQQQQQQQYDILPVHQVYLENTWTDGGTAWTNTPLPAIQQQQQQSFTFTFYNDYSEVHEETEYPSSIL